MIWASEEVSTLSKTQAICLQAPGIVSFTIWEKENLSYPFESTCSCMGLWSSMDNQYLMTGTPISGYRDTIWFPNTSLIRMSLRKIVMEEEAYGWGHIDRTWWKSSCVYIYRKTFGYSFLLAVLFLYSCYFPTKIYLHLFLLPNEFSFIFLLNFLISVYLHFNISFWIP